MKPDKKDPDAERLFEGLEPAPPPAELRSRALEAARSRASMLPDQDLWSRLWNHRGLRLAWVASVVLLLAGHAAMSSPSLGGGPTGHSALVADRGGDEFLGGVLRPARISEDVQPIVGLFAATDGLAELEWQRNPS
jgi:hypothetical protein